MHVGFIGLGRMGTAMAQSLVAGGHDVLVFNRTKEKTRPLVDAGARAASSLAELAGAPIVVTMLADDAAVESLLDGEAPGAAFGPGAIHVSMSTISVALSRRLTELHARAGGSFVSAPVFGRPEAAAAGKLFVVAAGPAAVLERCAPLFSALGQKTFLLGSDPSAANVMKLAGNFLLGATVEAMAEAFALARKSGLDAEQVLEVLTGTLFTAPFQKTYGGLIARGAEETGFALDLALKDFDLVLDAASDAKVPMPTAQVVHDRLTTGAGRGLGPLDWSVLGRLAAENAGIRDPRS